MLAMSVETNYWSTVLSFLAQQYFTDFHATCILWHESFDVQLETSLPLPVLLMDPQKWSSLEHTLDYERKRADLEENGVKYNDWILRLTLAIEQAHCESFIAFQEQIPQFAHAFYNASIYSLWRSIRNHFVFVYTDELLPEYVHLASYFDGFIFHDQPNILLVNAPFLNSTVFEIQTNQFVGPRYFGKERMTVDFEKLLLYDAQLREPVWDAGFEISHKLRNLQGREVVLGMFDYKPFMVLDYDKQPKVYNRAVDGSEVLVDGTEVRIMLNYCELYNCSVQVDTKQLIGWVESTASNFYGCSSNKMLWNTGTFMNINSPNIDKLLWRAYSFLFSYSNRYCNYRSSETSEWGDIYANYTGVGLMGMVLDRRTEYAVGGLYMWHETYLRMDVTQFQGRSGVTCIVPAPHPVINWALPLLPFQTTLWLCVLLCLLLECLALTCTRQCEGATGVSETPISWSQSLSFACVSTLKLFVNQSTSYVSTSYSLRIILLANYLIDMILTTVYGGGLATILTLPKFEEAADSRQRLYEHKLTWSGTSYAWITTFDVGTSDTVLLGLVERFRSYDAETIAVKSLTENMGFVVERLQFGHLANAEIIPNDALSRLKLMVDDIYFSYTAAYVPRLWAHLDAYNRFILAWHSSGFSKFWEWKISAEYMSANRQNRMAASRMPKHDIGPLKLGIANFIGLILLWCFGMTCSLLAFFVELWYLRVK